MPTAEYLVADTGGIRLAARSTSVKMQGPKSFSAFAARQPFLDIAMPPYQDRNDRNDRNKRNKNIKKVAKRDPLYIDGQAPRPMYVDYKDLDLLTKLTNRHGRIVSRRKTGCHAASQHAVARAIKRARFMALLPYVGD